MNPLLKNSEIIKRENRRRDLHFLKRICFPSVPTGPYNYPETLPL